MSPQRLRFADATDTSRRAFATVTKKLSGAIGRALALANEELGQTAHENVRVTVTVRVSAP